MTAKEIEQKLQEKGYRFDSTEFHRKLNGAIDDVWSHRVETVAPEEWNQSEPIQFRFPVTVNASIANDSRLNVDCTLQLNVTSINDDFLFAAEALRTHQDIVYFHQKLDSIDDLMSAKLVAVEVFGEKEDRKHDYKTTNIAIIKSYEFTQYLDKLFLAGYLTGNTSDATTFIINVLEAVDQIPHMRAVAKNNATIAFVQNIKEKDKRITYFANMVIEPWKGVITSKSILVKRKGIEAILHDSERSIIASKDSATKMLFQLEKEKHNHNAAINISDATQRLLNASQQNTTLNQSLGSTSKGKKRI